MDLIGLQKKPMQTDGWPERDEGKLPNLITEQDLIQAKNLILNWTKDLRAQPDVSSCSPDGFLQGFVFSV